MTDEELIALVHTLWHGEVTLATVASSADAITTLRAQLAEARAELVRRVDMHECAMAERDDATLYSDEQRARADRAEAALAAQIEADDLPPFRFYRYINGVLMAEGVEINKEATLDSAMKAASRIASKGPNGEVPVLVYRNQPRADRIKALIAERDEAEAKLAKAVEALEDIVKDCEADYPPSHGAIKYFALATLAEIKGESHE